MSDTRKPPGGGGQPPSPSPDRSRRVTDFDTDPASGFRAAPRSGFYPSPGTGSGARVTASVAQAPVGKAPLQPGYTDRAPRARVSVPVRYRYQSFIDFVESQSINVSRSGMFVASDSPLPVGTLVQFEFSLADGFVILRGTAEVMRVVKASANQPPGMGLRFQDMEEKSRKLIERIVEVNDEEGKPPSVPLNEILTAATAGSGTASPPNPSAVAFKGGTAIGIPVLPSATTAAQALSWSTGRLRLALNPITAAYFVNNPLLNIKMGGFVVPSDSDVPLGTLYAVDIVDLSGKPVITARGKVVAKQERRLGIRLVEIDKADLARLQAEVAKISPSK